MESCFGSLVSNGIGLIMALQKQREGNFYSLQPTTWLKSSETQVAMGFKSFSMTPRLYPRDLVSAGADR